jgi:hypothetical protein
MARPGLRQHPKFRRLVHNLGEPEPHALGYLECMWSVGYECGDSLLGDETDVELAALYPGPKGKLCAALLECRLIDKVDGKFHIHDLYDHAPGYVQRRMRLELQRRQNGQSISDLRRAAALKRWRKRDQEPDANSVQEDANGTHLHPLVSDADARGCKRMQQDATPAPAPAPSPSSPLTPQGVMGGGVECQKAWEEWTRYLAEKRKPLTPTREQRHLKALATSPPAERVARLYAAMERDWDAPARPDKLPAAAAPPETEEQRQQRIVADRLRRQTEWGPANGEE